MVVVSVSTVTRQRGWVSGAFVPTKNFAINVDYTLGLTKPKYKVQGAAETEFSLVRFKGDATKAAAVYAGYEPLKAEDIADIIYFVISRPYHVNIEDLIVYSTAQASATILKKEV